MGTSRGKLDNAAKQLTAYGELKTYVLDISNEEAVQDFADSITSLDYLVTTLARLTFKNLADLSKQEI